MLIIMFCFHLFFRGFAFCLCFYDCLIGFWNCSDSVVFFFLVDFGIVQTVWYFLFFWQILELFRQCGIFLLFCQILEFFRQCGIFCFSVRFWNCSDSVVCFVFLLDFGIVQTVWYVLFFCQILELFRECGIFCLSSHSFHSCLHI